MQHTLYNAIITLLQWKLPKDLDRLFNELKMGLTTVCAYVLIAKAKELILMQVKSLLICHHISLFKNLN